MERIRAAGDCSFLLLKPSRTETPSIEIRPEQLLFASGATASALLWLLISRERSGDGSGLVTVVAEDDPDEENH